SMRAVADRRTRRSVLKPPGYARLRWRTIPLEGLFLAGLKLWERTGVLMLGDSRSGVSGWILAWSALMRRLIGILSVWWLLGAGVVRAEVPTYSKDIAPILWKNCAGCHRPGEIGPFSLLTYRDAAKRARFLAEITESRRMPPWKPEPGFGAFHDER